MGCNVSWFCLIVSCNGIVDSRLMVLFVVFKWYIGLVVKKLLISCISLLFIGVKLFLNLLVLMVLLSSDRECIKMVFFLLL